MNRSSRRAYFSRIGKLGGMMRTPRKLRAAKYNLAKARGLLQAKREKEMIYDWHFRASFTEDDFAQAIEGLDKAPKRA